MFKTKGDFASLKLRINNGIKHKIMFFFNKFFGIKNKIIFTSFNGKSYSDNPRAISEILHEMSSDVEIVWLFNSPESKKEITPDYIRLVSNSGFKKLYELSTAKVWVDNFGKAAYVYKDKKQFYIQTWHGDRGFKCVLNEAWNNGKRPIPVVEERICDLAVAGSKYGEERYRKAFHYHGRVLVKGMPRNDMLVFCNEEIIGQIKKQLNIPDTTNILMYAPTFRDHLNKLDKQMIHSIDILKTLSTLENKTNYNWVALIRAHPSVTAGLNGITKSEKIIDVSKYEDMSDLLMVSDMLTTDYSSSAGDFVLTKKPVILFQSDVNEYKTSSRNFKFDINKSPYFVANSQDEIEYIINNLDDKTIQNNCHDILKFYQTNECGYSSEIIADIIIKKIGVEQSNRDNQGFYPSISSKMQLAQCLKKEKANYTGIHLFYGFFAMSEADVIWRYQVCLRKTEYYKNTNKRLRYYLSKLRLNRMSIKYGLNIPTNTCGIGLKIMHLGHILINSNVRIGMDCSIHIDVSIVAGGRDNSTPKLGNGIVIGVGATILGDVFLNDNIAVGANSVVNKSFYEKNIAIAGMPAKKISNNGRLEWEKN